eukprot:8129365-Pyramimonas_sp.AAC.1
MSVYQRPSRQSTRNGNASFLPNPRPHSKFTRDSAKKRRQSANTVSENTGPLLKAFLESPCWFVRWKGTQYSGEWLGSEHLKRCFPMVFPSDPTLLTAAALLHVRGR